MNLRPHRKEDPEINLTSLIDVVLMLLIFFMVATTFNRETELKVELPKASTEPTEKPQEAIEVVINAEGRYFIGGQEVINPGPQTLRRALELSFGDDRERPLVIRAAALAPHQSVVTAMDAAGQLGITHLSIATVKTESDQ